MDGVLSVTSNVELNVFNFRKNCGVNEILKPIGKNHIITPSENEIKNSIDYCLKNKKVILNQGKVNKMILAKSQCNSENLIRRFNRVINLN